jgi:glycosyltransferase involved in cell wall biosynthesis
MPLVSISNDQRRPLPSANFVATVQHGLPADLHLPAFAKGSYLAFLGRISPEKGPDRAIRIARAAGIPLKIAAKVDKVDEDYFRNNIRPLIDGRGVEFIGEINERDKTEFLGKAAALLFPVDWPEPFGLVMIEAMACGTACIPLRVRPGSHREWCYRQDCRRRGRSHRGSAGNPVIRSPCDTAAV